MSSGLKLQRYKEIVDVLNQLVGKFSALANKIFYLALVATILSVGTTATAQCSPPLELEPLPTIQGHVDLPVDDISLNTNHTCDGRTRTYHIVVAPPEFRIDMAGGRWYWTPETAGTHSIVIEARAHFEDGSTESAYQTYTAIVDENTITQPLLRDYLDVNQLNIKGRAKADANRSFESYELHYSILSSEGAEAETWHWIAGPILTPVNETGTLANWDLSALADGARLMLRMTVNLRDRDSGEAMQSVVYDRVIVDRSALPGWPKRVEPLIHSPLLVDLDDDGIQEVAAGTFHGLLRVWNIDGSERWTTEDLGTTRGGLAAGDVTGDGIPEIVWSGDGRTPTGTLIPSIFVFSADGELLTQEHLNIAQDKLRTPPTLADLDGDGDLEILQNSGTSNRSGWLHVYDFQGHNVGLEIYPGAWPRPIHNESSGASPSVAEIDHRPGLDIIVAGHEHLFAWNASGTEIPELHNLPFFSPITKSKTNGGNFIVGTSKPALADIDLDGTIEIIVGSNVFTPGGSRKIGWRTPKPSIQDAISAAIGDFDQNLGNGLEVVIGKSIWHADGSPATSSPLSKHMSPAVLADCGGGHVDAMGGTRGDASHPGILGFEFDGELEQGYPKSLYGETGDNSAPVVGDFNNDGIVELAATVTDVNYGGIIAIYQINNGPHNDENAHWPMLGHNQQNTGYYTPPSPNPPQGIIGGIDAEEGLGLLWQEIGNSTEGYVVQRSETGLPFSYMDIATVPPSEEEISLYIEEGNTTEEKYYRVLAFRTDPLTGKRIYSRPSKVVQPMVCFIATAAYGTADASQVQVLRDFRDEILMQSSVGRWLVKAYYNVSPPIAKAIAYSENAKAMVRSALRPLVVWYEKMRTSNQE